MTVETKSNGYKAEILQPMINTFETAAIKVYPECTINHFYYGDACDMVTLLLENNQYAHFNIYKNRVSLTGYTCSDENLSKFESMTYKDECYCGKLLQLAGAK